MQTTVALFIFNRPHTTAQVFAAIRQAQPPQLLVVADGPRRDRPDDIELCRASRSILEQIDWPCQVQTNYSDVNLGCKQRMASGLDWVFSLVEEAIILEDDCLPHGSFFTFCEDLLKKYREDRRIGIISGQNSLRGYRRSNDSYYFAQIPYIWGWATWRRSWNCYDFTMTHWPEVRDGRWLRDIFQSNQVAAAWQSTFEHNYAGFFDAWDYQLVLTSLLNNWLNPTANVNLVSNIGFGKDATNTSENHSFFANLQAAEIDFPLVHPKFLIADRISESRVFRDKFQVPITLKVDRAIRRSWRQYSSKRNLLS
jgi:hypothetical protein